MGKLRLSRRHQGKVLKGGVDTQAGEAQLVQKHQLPLKQQIQSLLLPMTPSFNFKLKVRADIGPSVPRTVSLPQRSQSSSPSTHTTCRPRPARDGASLQQPLYKHRTGPQQTGSAFPHSFVSREQKYFPHKSNKSNNLST